MSRIKTTLHHYYILFAFLMFSALFGVLKQHYGMRKARYLGLARNRTRFELMCVAHNIKRGLSILQESRV